MLFNSYFFLFLFLPLALAGWFLLNRCRQYKLAQGFLIGMSLWFYAYYNISFLWVIAGSCIFNYGISALLFRKNTPRSRKLFLAVGCLGNLGALGYFKYCNFFLENVNALFHADFQLKTIILPLGISFFTFQQMSYLIDRCRGEAPHYGLLDYLSFVTFFPSLISGPIVLHAGTVSQFREEALRRFDAESFAKGVMQFTMGLGKKVLLADTLALAVNYGYANIASLDSISGLAVACFYTLELYFDFSGYSDMAIGLGKMLGFDFNKNFDYPYISTSVSEFWRRWHISLGSWFRDYIYIPLGGNRVSTLKHIRNILVVWALTGLWHGASWNFVLWGVYYGLFLLLEKFVLQKYLKKIPSWLCTVYTMLVVMIGWVFFSQTDFGALGHYLGTMFGIGASGFIDKTALYYLKTGFILLLISILMCRPAPYQYFKRLVRRRPVAAVIINLILFALSIAYMVYNSYTPFLYAKF